MLFARHKLVAYTLVVAMAGFMLFPQHSYAGRVDERPSGAEMAGDALLRPFLVVATLAGTGIFVVTLPLSLLGGNVKESANALVVYPFNSTFIRCLGCTTRNMGKSAN